MNQLNADIITSLNMTDASSYRVAAATAAAASAASSSTSSTGTTSTTGTTGTSSTTASTTTSSTTTTDAIILPFGVQGDNQSISLFLPKFPKEAWPTNVNDVAQTIGDVRSISYWYVDGKGLYRQEIKQITDPNSLLLLPPNGSPPSDDSLIIAPEVRGITFSYYDGTEWQDTWDGTTLGADGVTPIGPPQAIQITLLLAPPPPLDGSGTDEQQPLSYKHVIAIGTANGTTTFTPPTTPSSNSGSGM